MTETKKLNYLKLNIFESDIDQVLLAQYLRSSGNGIKLSAFEAIRAFFYSVAIAECTDSSKEEIEKALLYCLSAMKHRMTELMDYHSRENGITVCPDLFSSVMINPSVRAWAENDQEVVPTMRSMTTSKTEILDCSPAAETTGRRSSRENQERSDEIDRQIAQTPPAQQPQPIPVAIPVAAVVSVDDDDDDDYDENETDEEYLARTAHLVKITSTKLVD